MAIQVLRAGHPSAFLKSSLFPAQSYLNSYQLQKFLRVTVTCLSSHIPALVCCIIFDFDCDHSRYLIPWFHLIVHNADLVLSETNLPLSTKKAILGILSL
jgi:hypothetical protein